MRKYNIHNQNTDHLNSNSHNSQRREDSHSHSHDQDNNFGYFHTMLQNYMQNNTNIIPSHIQPMHHDHDECQANTCSSGMITSLFNIVSSQAQSLENLNKKVEEMVQRNKQLTRRVKELEIENEILRESENKKQQPQINRKQPVNDVKIEGESVNKQSLLKILFGQQKYEYKLRLIEPLDQPLYRQRNFNIHMELVDMNDERVPNSNKIPMSLALYTCQNPPKFIEKNTAGQKMLKGFVDQSLLLGICNFQKVQIREVTSHYRGGWIFLVAIPCMTPLGANKIDNFVDFTKIKPLVIDEVVVKAKKPKKKDDKKDQSGQQVL